jgi:hypothetical protein
MALTGHAASVFRYLAAMKSPSPPVEHYEWLGRITAAASHLEVQLGQVGQAAISGDPYVDDWEDIAGAPSQAWNLANEAIALLEDPLRQQLREILAACGPLQRERNAYAHGALAVDPTVSSGSQWVIETAKYGKRPALTRSNAADLVAEIHRLAKRTNLLRGPVAEWARERKRQLLAQPDGPSES